MDNSDIIQHIERGYWGRFKHSELNDAMRYYICEGHRQLDGKSLLEAELDCARREGRLAVKPCETLVLLVGFSLEPLLQSVCVYRPQKIILVLNQEGYPPEEWQTFTGHVTEAIGHLVGKGLLAQPPQFPGKNGGQGYPTADSPEAVFQALVEALRDETDVVIDVTGGKKSMVSGAYMYAAYAGTRISYVDFDEYDPERRRPYGYSCRIGELANPYQEFALREWERVRALYERHQFREAQVVLDSISPTMKRVMPATEQPILTLAAFLAFYEQWDRGDYRGAKQTAQNLPAFAQPSAVSVLGDRWFEVSGNDFSNKPGHFYGDVPVLRAYVCDELVRIRRLIDYNEDYRSAFLRAGSVNEIVMLARVVSLVPAGPDKDLLLDALDQRTPEARKVFDALINPNKTVVDVKKDIGFTGAPNLQISRPVTMTPWWKMTEGLFNADDGWETFLNRRNDLTHKYFSVPKEWADDALVFVQANFEDFLGHPIADLNMQTEALAWPELCDLCGLSRFLPPSLR